MPRPVRRLLVPFLPLIPFAAACSAAPSLAIAAMPSLFWRDIKTVSVTCLVQNRIANAPDLTAALCSRVRDLVAKGAPGPVRVIEMGDRALVAPANVTFLVHASVDAAPGGRALAFTIRPYRAMGGEDEIRFGSGPRIVPMKGSGTDRGPLDAALSAALAEVVPWQAPANPVGQPLYSRSN